MADRVTIKRICDVARLLGSPLIGGDAPFKGVSTDSRSIAKGELFIALKGSHFNGEKFLPMALERGAVAALVSDPQDVELPQIVVEDTLQALGTVAAAWRSQFKIPLLAITGSNGKTTVKEMVAAILRQQDTGTVTQGNLNNAIGVPLTLLNISPMDRWAVVEMGASAVGEIDYLARMAAPTASLANNAGAAHLGGFGSLQQIVEAKGEIYSALPEDGVAVINHELPQQAEWSEMASGRVCYFGYAPSNQVSLSGTIDLSQPFRVSRNGEEVVVDLPLPGEHSRINALAAATLSLQAGATLQQIRRGLEQIQPVAGRLFPLSGRGGATLIDDCYNASPESMRSAIDVLAARTGKRVLVAGDMGEMGEAAAQLHHQIGKYAAEQGVDQLHALGEHAVNVVSGFGGGAAHGSLETLLEALESSLNDNTTILIKGSRFMKMERVVSALALQDEKQQPEQGETTQ